MHTPRCATIEETKNFNAKERERFNIKEKKKTLMPKRKKENFNRRIEKGSAKGRESDG